MKKALPSKRGFITFSFQERAFTLVELLVVITIISILSVVGSVAYSVVQKNARDTKRREDVDAIAKAYEVKYTATGAYSVLSGTGFNSGSIPQDPSSSKGDYFNVVANDGSGFKVCASLEANSSTQCNSPGINCYCKGSLISSINDTSISGLSGNGSGSGWGGSGSSCDTNGTLGSGLTGYWKMDENSWTNNCSDASVTDSSGNGNNGKSCPAASGLTEGSDGRIGKAGSFDGTDYVEINDPFSNNTDFTIALWANPSITGKGFNALIGEQETVDNIWCRKPGLWYYKADDDRTYLHSWIHNSSCDTEFSNITTGVSNSNFFTNTETWYHIVWTKRGDISTFYKNGTQVATDVAAPATFYNNADTKYRIGMVDNYWKGSIDDVRIYNRVLSQGEISLLASGCVSPP